MANRLAAESSPYLLQHADNPVDWRPWGAEALARAALEDKPILLSVGYAACHWCHVMAHESFEDEAIAALINRDFVPVKVDREERPDVDAIYMQAVQSLTGHGGWPLTAFLTPDGRPFYGGTYFPPEDRHGMPGFPRVLAAVQDAYRNRRDDVLRNAQLLTKAIEDAAALRAEPGELSVGILDDAFLAIAEAHDAEFGGFGAAPKFPQSMPMEFLLRYYARAGAPEALAMVERSLLAMADGGIYDHLGGGFHRYSTDAQWLVPHFEKMLYDNALLASLYLQAYQATRNERYRAVAEQTLDYMLRELGDPAGGLYSSQDADSEGVEGKFYVWEKAEVDVALGAAAQAFGERYDVTPGGNWEGRTILRLTASGAPDSPAIREARARLFALRAERVAPGIDDKALTAWNALALRALAEAAAILERSDYRERAVRLGEFLLANLYVDGRLLRSWKAGRARLNGYLEDYAALALALLALHEATFEHRWLHDALRLADEMLGLFWDERSQLLYDVGSDHERLVVRPRDTFDNAVPCGSSMAAEALLRLGRLAGRGDLVEVADVLFKSVGPLLGRYPLGFGNWLKALELRLAPPRELAIVGAPGAASELTRAANGAFRPHLLRVMLDPGEAAPFASPVLEGRGLVGGAAAAYVCRNYACDLPASDAAELRRQLDAAG